MKNPTAFLFQFFRISGLPWRVPHFRFQLFKFLLFPFALALAPGAQAATQYAAGTLNWADSGGSIFWSSFAGGPYNVAWTSGNDAVFGGTAGTVTISGAATVHNLNFNTTSYILSGANTLTLSSSTPTLYLGPGISATMGNNTATVLAGSAGLTLAGAYGAGTLTFNPTAVSTLTGGITLNGATLLADFSNMGSTANLINSGNVLTLGGGNLSINGNSANNSSQTLGNLTVNAGGGQILLNPNGSSRTATLTLGTITETAAGGTLLMGASTATGTTTITTTSGTLANGIYSGRAVYTSDGGTTVNWATTASGSSPYTLSAYSGYTTTLPTATGDSTLNYKQTANNSALTANIAANSWKVEGPAASQSLALGAYKLTLTSGGFLCSGANAFTVSGTAAPGLTAVNGSGAYDLIFQQYNSGGLTVSAVIGNNGANSVSVTKAGSGQLTLSGANTYSGGTFINAGQLTITSDGNLGAVPGSPTVNLTLNGGKLYGGNATFTIGANRTIYLGPAGGIIQQGNSLINIIAGKITGPGSLGINYDLKGWKISNSGNDYSGDTIIGAGTTQNYSPTLQMGVANALPYGTGKGNVLFGLYSTYSGILDLNGYSVNLNGLSSASAYAVVTNSSTTSATITVGNNDQSSTFAGAVKNGTTTTLALTKTGSGTLTLSGANTYTGATAANAGTLVTTTASTGAGAYSVAGSATLSVKLAAANATLNMSSLSASASSTIEFNLNNLGTPSSSSPVVTVSGTFTPTATTTLRLTPGGSTFTTGQFPLIKYTTFTHSDLSAFTLVVPGGVTANLVDNTANKSIDVNITAIASQVWDGTVSGNWDIGSSANWKTSATYNEFGGSGPNVTFDDTATGPNTTITSGSAVTVSPQSVTVNNSSKTYSIGGNVSIGGSGTLTKTGSGTLTLSGQNTFTGNVPIGDSSGNNGFTGGTVDITSSGALGTGTKTVSIRSSSTTLQIDGTGGSVSLASGIGFITSNPSGNGAIENLGGNNTINGTIQMNSGVGDTLIKSDAGSLTLAGVINAGTASRTLVLGGASTGANTVSGIIADGSAANSVTKQDAGTWVLSGANTFTGGTALNGGTLDLSNQKALQSSTLTMGGGSLVFDSIVSGNAFTLGGLAASSSGAGYDIALQNNAGSPAAVALTVGGNNASTTYAGNLSAAGSLTKTGTGALTLSGNNAYAGVTAIGGTAGGIVVGANNALGTTAGNTTVAAGTSLGFSGGINYSTTETIVGSGAGSSAVGAFAATQRGFVQSVSGNNTFAGPIQINATGVTRIGMQNGAPLTLSGAITMSGVSGVTVLFRAGDTTGDFVTLANNGNNSWDTDTQIYTANTTGAGLKLGADNALPTGVSVVGAASTGTGTELDLAGFSQTMNGLTSSSTTLKIINSDNTRTSVLTLNNTANKNTSSGTVIQDGAGKIQVVKLGSYDQIIQTASTYTGGTLIKNGSITLQSGDNRLATAGTVTLGDASTTGKLVIGESATARNQTLAGLLTSGSGGSVVGAASANSVLTLNITSGNNSFSGTLGGTGNENNLALTKSGAGTLTLSGANTYTGPTAVSAGTLALSGSGTLGTGSSLTLGGGTLDLGGLNPTVGAVSITTAASSGNTIQNGSLTGTSYAASLTTGNAIVSANLLVNSTAGLTKSGAGTLTLSGANTYTGPTAVNAGTLLVNSPGYLNANSAVTVASGATLGGNGTINGTVNVSAGGILAPGGMNNIGTLTLANNSASSLTLNGNLLYFDLPASGTTCDLITISGASGALVLNGTNYIQLTAPSGVQAGNYTLMTYATKTGSGTLMFPNGATTMTVGGSTLTLTVGSSSVTLNVSANIASSLNSDVWSGAASYVWDGGALNWMKNGTASQAYADGDAVTFDDTGLAASTITSGGTVSPSLVVFNNNVNSYTVSATIGGTGTPLVKNGTGALTLSGANAYTGGTTLNGGTLTLGNASGLGNSTVTLAGGTFNGANYTVANAISVQTGTSTTISAGNGTLSGPITGTGTFALNSAGGATLTISGDISGFQGTFSHNNVSSGSNFRFHTATPAALNGSKAKFYLTGLTSGENRALGSDNGGTLQMGELAGTGGVIGYGLAAFTLQVGALNTSSTFSGVIVTTGTALTKVGTGTLTLNGANGYTGATAVNAGTLLVNSPGSLAATAVTVASGATLGGNGTISGTVNVSAGGYLAPGGINTIGTLTLAANSASSLTLNGNQLFFDLPASGTTCDLITISGASGALVLNGANYIMLTAPSGAATGTYTLMTYAAKTGSGTLTFPNGSTTMTIGSSTLTLTVGSTSVTLGISGAAVAALNSDVWSGTASYAWDASSANWTKNGTASSAFSAGDAVTFDDTGLAASPITGSGTVSPGSVIFNNSVNNYTVSATIGGSGSLVKLGTATTTLSGANTYTGTSTLNAGTVNLGIAESVGSSGPLGNSVAANPGSIVLGGATLQYSSVNNNDYSGRFSTAASQAYNLDVNGQTVTLGTALTSSGGTLTLKDTAGSGKLTLSAANTYSGVTTINGGVLSANTIADSGSSSIGLCAAANALTLGSSGGTLNFTGSSGATTRAMTFTGPGTFNVANGSALNVGATAAATSTSGLWTGNGGIIVNNTGTGTLTIRNNSTATSRTTSTVINSSTGGTFTMQNGTLNISPVNASGAAYFIIGDTAIGEFDQTGGTVNYTPAYNNGANQMYVGITSSGTLNVSGGTFTVDPTKAVSMIIGRGAASTVSIGQSGGGGVTAAVDTPIMHVSYPAASSSGTLNLYQNGVLITRQLDNYGSPTYPGYVKFDGGTLKVKDSSFSSPFMSATFTSATLTGNGATVDPNSYAVTIAQALTDASGQTGKLMVNDSSPTHNGTVTLSGVNTYSGATTISGGKLVGAVNSSCANSDVTVNNAAGCVLGVSITNNTMSWSCKSVTFAGANAGLEFDFSGSTAPGSMAPLVVSGAANFTGTPTVTITGVNLPAGDYPLMTWGSYAGTLPTTAVMPSSRQTGTLSLSSDTKTLMLHIGTTLPLTWQLGTGIWDSGAGEWKDTGGNATTYQDGAPGDSVMFDDTPGSGAYTVTLGNAYQPAAVTVNNNNANYTISGSGGIGGSSTALTKSGTGSLTLATANSYAGGTAINGGIVTLSSPGTLGASAPLTMSGGTLDLGTLTTPTVGAVSIMSAASSGNTIQNGSLTGTSYAASLSTGNATVSVNLLGSASLTMVGSGTLTLSGANSYTGGTTISAGTLTLSGANSYGAGSITVAGVAGNAVLNVNGSANITNTGSIQVGKVNNANGALYLSAGTLTNTATSSETSFTFGYGNGGYGYLGVSGGTLSIGNSSTDSRLQFGGQTAPNTTGTGVGLISGGTVNVSQYLIIGRTNGSYASLTVSGGNLNHLKGSGAASANISLGHGGGRCELNLTGGQIDSTGTSLAVRQGNAGMATGIVNLDSGTLIVNSFVNTSGNAYLNFNGGTLKASANSTAFIPSTMTEVNVYSGGATIDSQTYNITNTAALLAPGNTGVTDISMTVGTGVNKGSGCIGAPYVSITGGTLAANGSPATAIANMVDDSTGNGTFKVDSITITCPGVYTDTSTLAVSFIGGGGSGGVAGTISTAVNTSGGLTKLGTGRLALSAASTYTNTTTISVGTLALSGSGSINNSANVVVSSGATFDVSAVTGGYSLPSGKTLTGKGTVHGAATIAGTLAPGADNGTLGTLTFDNTLTLSGAANFRLNKSGATLASDQVAGATSITVGGTLNITASGDTLANGDSFTLLNTGTGSSWFSTASLPALPTGLTWDTNHLATAGYLDVYGFTTNSIQTMVAISNTPTTLLKSKVTAKTAGGRGTVTVLSVNSQSGATVGISGGNITYTPPSGFAGNDTFTAVLSDGHGSITATIYVTVSASNTGPTLTAVDNGSGYGTFTSSGIRNQTYTVQISTQLPTWIDYDTVTALDNGLITYTDSVSISGHGGTVYYRIRQ